VSLSSSGSAVPKKHFRGHFDLKIGLESSGSDYPLAQRRIPAQDGQCTVTIVAVEKPLSITYSLCAKPVIRHAGRMRPIIVTSGLYGSTIIFRIVS